MIIKMTLHDNDFTRLLEQFCDFRSGLYYNLYFGLDEDVPQDVSERFEWYRHRSDLQNCVNSDGVYFRDITNNIVKELVCKEVIYLWSKFVERFTDEAETQKYLLSNFSVFLTDCLIDEDEGYEVVYYFVHCHKYITQ